jgi:hypothetical protein
MKVTATIEYRGLKLDVEFDLYVGKKPNLHGGDPDYDGDEVDEILSIKVHGTDVELTSFLDGDYDESIVEYLNDWLHDNADDVKNPY